MAASPPSGTSGCATPAPRRYDAGDLRVCDFGISREHGTYAYVRTVGDFGAFSGELLRRVFHEL
eukprot:8290978-Alexandrium_andersonii.AAC.1